MLSRPNVSRLSCSLWLALLAWTAASGRASAFSGTITCNGTDVTAALNAALASSVTDGTGQITFTAGTCIVSSAVSRTMTGMHGLQLQGAGLEATTVQFTNGGGFSFTLGFYTSGINFMSTLSLKGLSIITTGASPSDTCINVDGQTATSAGAFGGASSVLVRDVYCRNSGAAAWSQGVHLTSVSSVDLINFNYFGAVSPTKTGTGINIENHLACCETTQYNVIGGRVDWAATAILVTGKIQGLIANNFNAAAVTNGLYWSTDAAEAECSIANSQIAAEGFGIFTNNCAQSTINNNLIYILKTGGIGIYLIATYDTAITGNNVQGGPNNNEIVLQGASFANILCNNVVRNASTGIWLQSGTSGNTVCNNIVNGASTGKYLDQGPTSGPSMNLFSGNR